MNVQTDIKSTINRSNEEAWALVRSNPRRCIDIASKLLTESEKIDYAEGMAQALSCIGGAKVWLSKYDEALDTLYAAQESFQILGYKTHEAQVVYHIFCSFYFLADYDKALTHAHHLLTLADENNDSNAKANAYNGIGTIYYSIGENEKAVEYLQKGLDLAEKGNDKHLLARITDGIGTAFLQLHQLNKALIYKERSWEAARDSGRKNEEGYALNGLASVYHSSGNPEKAEDFYLAAIRLRKETDFRPGVAEGLSSLGSLYLDENRNEEALNCLNEALSIANDIESREILYKIHESLSRYYEKKNNFPEYKEHLGLFYSNKEIHTNEQNRQKLKTAEMQMRMAQVEKEKELLEKKHREVERTAHHTKMMSGIGKEIASILSVEEIIETVYKNIHELMDADAFGIGIYRPEYNDLFHTGVMEKGQKLPDFSFSLDEERIACICFHKSQEIIINDWNKEYRQYASQNYAAKAGESPVSMIYIPLLSGNRTIGVMSVQSFKSDAYTQYHLDIIRSLSVYIGSALKNANLYEKMEERVKERTAEIEKAYQNTKLLSSISKEISSSLSVETIVASVYRNVNDLMDAASFGIGIFNPVTRYIDFPGFIEKGQHHDNVSFHVDDDRLAVWCFRNQKEIVTNDYTKDYNKYVKGIKAVVAGKHSQSIIYLPLFTKEKIIGVLTIQSYELNAYSDYHLDILRNLANSISIAIDNATLYSNLEEKVKERTTEVVKQKEIIEEKNKHITDSIIYAKRIQRAILPPEETFNSYLNNSFVLYKPKDIVSGDFYWIEKKENKILFAVVDCTGHGVPGAFMSIIGYNGLNQIVNEYNVTQPDEILNRLNSIITNTLKQHADQSKIRDGMDMSVCCIDLKERKLEYAGANNPIFIVREGVVKEVKADKHPIGNFVGEKEFHFTNNRIELEEGDSLYLFSDGYADQFGGPRGKKLKYTQFRELLLKHHLKPMKQQKIILDALFEEWRGDLEQIDDVCVIGLRI